MVGLRQPGDTVLDVGGRRSSADRVGVGHRATPSGGRDPSRVTIARHATRVERALRISAGSSGLRLLRARKSLLPRSVPSPSTPRSQRSRGTPGGFYVRRNESVIVVTISPTLLLVVSNVHSHTSMLGSRWKKRLYVDRRNVGSFESPRLGSDATRSRATS